MMVENRSGTNFEFEYTIEYMNDEIREKLRNFALDWQCNFAEQDYSWGELAYWCGYFEAMGRRYGLLQEFRENGIL